MVKPGTHTPFHLCWNFGCIVPLSEEKNRFCIESPLWRVWLAVLLFFGSPDIFRGKEVFYKCLIPCKVITLHT